MGMILLEALGALLALVGIVWWTMFAGRKSGERVADAVLPPPSGGMAEEGGDAPTSAPAKPPAPPTAH